MRATLTSLSSYHCTSAQTTQCGLGTGVLSLCQEGNNGNDALEEFDPAALRSQNQHGALWHFRTPSVQLLSDYRYAHVS